MEIRGIAKTMTESLSTACTFIERDPLLPVLGDVLLRPEGDGWQWVASDMETEIRLAAPVMVENGHPCSFPARKLLEICKRLPDAAEILIEVKRDRAKIWAGNTHCTLQGYPFEHFPLREPMKEIVVRIEVDAAELSGALRRCAPAMAKNDSRTYLNGLCLECPDTESLQLSASDGHRLHHAVLPAVVEILDAECRPRMIVPRKTVEKLIRWVPEGDLALRGDGHCLIVESVAGMMNSLLVDAHYPQVSDWLRKKSGRRVQIPGAVLRDCLGIAEAINEEENHTTSLRLRDGILEIRSSNSQNEYTETDVPVLEMDDPGSTPGMDFNGRYLDAAIKTAPGDLLLLDFGQDHESCLIREVDASGATGDTAWLIMGLRKEERHADA